MYCTVQLNAHAKAQWQQLMHIEGKVGQLVVLR